ncbi:MAG: lipid A export permease/ATP-binding protein MsbA [Xanthomonadales bacterium PRO7]|nr:lipid A export permease/ATP-binding protein MsbA [Xanthomonadales bacterium PRO7]HMM56213.1 lipid A export permease/ATP-binding protein MsbA [Rudaea sp.]
MSDDAHASASPWSTWRRLLGYSSRYWPIALLAMLGMIFDAACGSVFTLIIKPMLDDLFVHKDKATIFWMPIFIVGLFLVRGMATYTAGYNMAKIARGVIATLRAEVFRKYLTLPAAFFQRESSSVQISRMTFTVEQVANASTDGLKILVLDGLMIIGQVSVMMYNSARLTVALFVLAPPVALIVWYVGKRYRRISHRIQDSVGSITGMVDEVVNGQREVRIYGGRDYERSRFAVVNESIRRLNLKIASTNSMANAVVQFVAAFALALVIFLATRPGAILREMSPGTFMSLITAMLVMLPSLKRLTTVQSNMQRGVVAAQDIFAVLDTDEERDTGTLRVERARGEIALDGVTFAYPGIVEPALRGIDLHCLAGSVTALVGRSGSGKSTLASLIPRFHDPDAGQIRLDGKPLADYALDNLRAQIAWVGQQVVIFDDTVARNIAYGALGKASREAIVEAARAANALDFIDALPNGLDSRVGEGGALLSGGQRQRIAIARAILKDAPILILDEATSALDSESEALIQDALKRLLRQRTVIVIAHRLSTIEHADRIAVLDAGRVVETGTHTELLARDGQYALLHRMQFRDNGGN